MAGIGTTYQTLINQVVTTLKTISELTGTPNDIRVLKWDGPSNPEKGRYEAIVMAGPMTVLGATTVKSTNNEFDIIVDLLHFSEKDFETGFDNAMGVAEKIYDKFHLTTINGLVHIAKVEIFPGDGTISGRNLLAIPIRITIKGEKVITQ